MRTTPAPAAAAKLADHLRHAQHGGPAAFGELAEQAERFQERRVELGNFGGFTTAGEGTQQAGQRAERHGVRVRLEPAAPLAEFRHEPEPHLASGHAVLFLAERRRKRLPLPGLFQNPGEPRLRITDGREPGGQFRTTRSE